ncbi:MAG: purine-nucleoside phosphorylase [Deltaproteobacteria bacterium]|nr:purine-nucleoside phosphorylase [Deltaproteobacteria bacterium]
MDWFEEVTKAAAYLKSRLTAVPQVAVVLGSGLGFLESQMKDAISIPYGEIPGFPVSTVPGHSGRLVSGSLGGTPALLFCGRVHLYEGLSPQKVAMQVRTAGLLGVKAVLLTNAAGGLDPTWTPGEIMLITDHVNLQGTNVLCGPVESRFGERFVDLTDAYDAELRSQVRRQARAMGIVVREGVYLGLLGPSYETRAEIRMFRLLGVDAVGMSTVQETIAARQLGMRVLGFSVVTNMAAGLSFGKLSHDEVKETAARVQKRFSELLVASVRTAGQVVSGG